MAKWAWYGVKTLYRTTAHGRPVRRDAHYDARATLIEERVVLVRARSFDEAVDKGEVEARKYANALTYSNPYGQEVKMAYLEQCDAFQLFQDPANRREVYSRTEVVSGNASASAVADRLLGAEEPAEPDRRRKFLPG